MCYLDENVSNTIKMKYFVFICALFLILGTTLAQQKQGPPNGKGGGNGGGLYGGDRLGGARMGLGVSAGAGGNAGGSAGKK
ncbi:uncharacterized protein LOC126882326 [Diabrotica virgifera virgifera]|uniref:Uncharacterized protein n=1 Tax=Diabrotica virgifera virgifera TaxID=50390 RepID=A0ABM5JYZ3_DIAVI|nr:uncharacterized protein LOC126882326 [Diabrotica virgifera virgifera]